MQSAQSPRVDIEEILYESMFAAYAGSSKRKLLEFVRFDYVPGELARLESMSRTELAEIYCRNVAARIVSGPTGGRRSESEVQRAMHG